MARGFGGIAAAVALALASTGSAPAAARADDALVAGAFRDAQMIAGARTGLALSRSAARFAAGDPVLARLAEARVAAIAARDAAAAREVALRSAAAPDAAAIAAATATARIAAAGLAAAEAAVAARMPGYLHLAGIAPVAIADAQRLLARDEAIVLIAPSSRATYVFVVRARRIGWTRAALGADALAAEVRALRVALDPAGTARSGEDAAPAPARPRRPAFPRARAYALYRALLGEQAPLLAGADTLYVVAGGALGALPLGVLVTRAPQGDDADPAALRRTRWLVRAHALVALPSVGSLRALRAAGTRPVASVPFAGFGDPALDGAPGAAAPRSMAALAAGGSVGQRIKALPRLPGTGNELRAMAGALGAGPQSLVLGAAATERAVETADLAGTRVVAFATHGLLAGEMGALDEPALVLTPPAIPAGDGDDGLLTASEAARLTLSADWVILSACNTAAADGSGDGEGLSGLARGFFSAGARAVLASHWRVRDDAAVVLTAGTLRRYAGDPAAGRAKALQRAMLAMIDDRAHPDYAAPALWAPFVVAGEGR